MYGANFVDSSTTKTKVSSYVTADTRRCSPLARQKYHEAWGVVELQVRVKVTLQISPGYQRMGLTWFGGNENLLSRGGSRTETLWVRYRDKGVKQLSVIRSRPAKDRGALVLIEDKANTDFQSIVCRKSGDPTRVFRIRGGTPRAPTPISPVRKWVFFLPFVESYDLERTWYIPCVIPSNF